ncbi:hypothetical protein [Micromonospora zamorensis]|uniref:hypothetical protein n=1 Tax=Micromonospora zamorensis TaxID=709883 RepID=UPI0033AD3789
MGSVAQRMIGGRIALDRAGTAAHTGAAYSTVNHWHRHRVRFGFPEGFRHDDKEWFWLDDIESFHASHLSAKRAVLTRVSRSGDPNDLVTSGGAAKILGYASYRNLPRTLLDQADQVEVLPSGRLRRRWLRRTVWAVADARTGRHSTGRTPGTTGARKPHPYADDPRLLAAIELLTEADTTGLDRRGLGLALARQLGITPRTAQRLLATASKPSSTLQTQTWE